MNLIKSAPAILAVLALVGCQTEEPATDYVNELAAEQVAPPGAGGLTLVIDGALIPGNALAITVAGAQPGERVFFARGSAEVPGSLCPAALNGLCVDIATPSVMSSDLADAQGVATFAVNSVPNIPDGFVAYFQAATGGATAATSQVVAKFNLLPVGNPNRTMGFILVEDATVTATSFDGVRSEINFSNALGLDLCILDISMTSAGLGTLPVCTDCDWAFDVEHTVARDGSVNGDCLDIFNFDPATIAPFNLGRGYAPTYYISGYGDYETVFTYDTTNTAWAAYVFAPVGTGLYDAATGEFGWGVDFGDYTVY
jgi:hypothetical protein